MSNLSILQNAGQIFHKPYPHIIIENALPEKLFNELHSTLPEEYVVGKPLGPDHGRRVKYHTLDEDRWPITDLWREFFEYHTSRTFFDEVMNLFEEYMPILPIHPQKIITDRGSKHKQKINCYQDCQFVRHNVIPAGETTRTPHFDNLFEIFAGLLYFKHDTSTGGDFHIHEQTQLPMIMLKSNNAIINPGPIVRTAPYKNNTVALFLNSRYAIHSVEPRYGIQLPRWSVNIIGRYTNAKMG